MDTALHRCTTVDEFGTPIELDNRGFAPVYLGDDLWVAFRSTIMPGTIISSPKCIIAAHSLTNKSYCIKPYTMLAGVPAKVVKEGIWMNRKDDKITY